MGKKRSFFNLDVTLDNAVSRYKQIDPLLIAERAQLSYQPENCTFILPFINRNYHIDYPSGRVLNEEGEPVSAYLSIIMLHYLVTADGTPLTGRWIAYRHLPGGDIYNEPFKKRAITPFLKTFEQAPDLFQKAVTALGGYRLDVSGVAMALSIMPRVPIGFVLWPGDDEMPSSANVLYDEAAPSYLPTEDYAHLPAIITSEMKKILK